MIVLFRGSGQVVELYLVGSDFEVVAERQWQAGRQMAAGLLKFLTEALAEQGMGLGDISAIGAYLGPGSYTSLRIGLTVMNTLANDLKIPIVGVASDDSWRDRCLEKLRSGQDDRVVMPFYGSEVHITAPKR